MASDAKVYFCAQNLITYHPDFDAILGEILRRDPKGLLVLNVQRRAERRAFVPGGWLNQ